MILMPHQVLRREGQFLSYVAGRGAGTTSTGASHLSDCVAQGRDVAIITQHVDQAWSHNCMMVSVFTGTGEPWLMLREGVARWPKQKGWATLFGLNDENLVQAVRSQPFSLFWCDDLLQGGETAEEVGRIKHLLNAMRRTGAEIMWTGRIALPVIP